MTEDDSYRRDASHLAQMLVGKMMKDVHNALVPKEIIVEVPSGAEGEPEQILLYRQRVLDIASSATTWSALFSQFQMIAQLNKQCHEIRVIPYGEFILLVSIELIGPKE
jgi:hypothetical protein